MKGSSLIALHTQNNLDFAKYSDLMLPAQLKEKGKSKMYSGAYASEKDEGILMTLFQVGIIPLLFCIYLMGRLYSSYRTQDANEILAGNEIPNKNSERLAAAGITPSMARDHKLLGFFYDHATLEVTKNPVILNTGDIADESTAISYVKNQSRLPRGTVNQFFPSFALEKVLDALIVEEENKAKNQLT